MDAEIAALRPALASGNVRLLTETDCLRVLTTREVVQRVTGVLLRYLGREQIAHANVVALCAGLVGGSLLRRSRTPKHPQGLGNASGCLGRYAAGHSAGIMFPFISWKLVPPTYTKTFAINGYYNGTAGWPYPIGVIRWPAKCNFGENGRGSPAMNALARRHTLCASI